MLACTCYGMQHPQGNNPMRLHPTLLVYAQGQRPCRKAEGVRKHRAAGPSQGIHRHTLSECATDEATPSRNTAIRLEHTPTVPPHTSAASSRHRTGSSGKGLDHNTAKAASGIHCGRAVSKTPNDGTSQWNSQCRQMSTARPSTPAMIPGIDSVSGEERKFWYLRLGERMATKHHPAVMTSSEWSVSK